MSDFKAPARIVNPKAQPIDATPKISGVCPCCQRHVGRSGLTRHHVVPKGQGGDDVPQNLVWVCGDGTRGCHGVLTHRNRDGETGLTFNDVAASLIGYACRVRALHDYADAKKWDGFIVDYYMPLTEAA